MTDGIYTNSRDQIPEASAWPAVRKRNRPQGAPWSRRNESIAAPVDPPDIDVSGTADLPAWLNNALDVLVAMPRVENWDGYGARPTSRDAMARAFYVLENLASTGVEPRAIVPTVHGDIQLEWHVADTDIEAVITKTGFVALFKESGNETQEVTKPATEATMLLAEWLTESASGA